MAANRYVTTQMGPPQPPGLTGLSPLDEEIANDEAAMEMYGGDDVQDPEKRLHKKMPSAEVHEVVPEPALVAWDGPDDPENPQNFPMSKKWTITMVCSILTVNATFASAAPAIVAPRIIERFHISREVSTLITVLFLLGYCFGPVLWGPGSEIFGRRAVLLTAMSCYTLLFLGQALAKNIQTVFIIRFLSGVFGSAPLVTCAGIIADIWNAQGRGYGASIFGSSVFLGPSLGPLVGGFVAGSYLGWEWIFWVMMIFGGAVTLIAVPFLPETYAPILLSWKAKRLRKQDPIGNERLRAEHENQDWSAKGLVDRTFFRPWKMFVKEPILMMVTVYMSFVYGLLYALLEALPIIFVELRHFTISQQGLIFIGMGIGSILTLIINLLFARSVNKIIPKWKGFPPAELRLYGAMIGSIGLVISVFWMGWSGNYPSVPWYVPALSIVFVGMSISLVFISFIVYLIDTYLMFAATALASNTILRSAMGAAFPLFTTQMYHNLGVNWASTLVGFLCLLMAPMPFLFFKYGPRIRERSIFAPCLDLKIAKQIKEEEELARLQGSVAEKTGHVNPHPAAVEEGRKAVASDAHSVTNSVTNVLLETIQQLNTTVSEVQYLLHEVVASQAGSYRAQQETLDAIRQLRDSLSQSQPAPNRRSSVYGYGWSDAPVGTHSTYGAPQTVNRRSSRSSDKRRTDWGVRLAPIDLTGVSDLHGIALSFARMTYRGNAISPQVRGRLGGPRVLIISWKTEEEAQAFYDAWSEAPPTEYATLSVIPSF